MKILITTIGKTRLVAIATLDFGKFFFRQRCQLGRQLVKIQSHTQ